MNDFGSSVKALNVIHTSSLSMTRKNPSYELKALDAMNSSGLWMT